VTVPSEHMVLLRVLAWWALAGDELSLLGCLLTPRAEVLTLGTLFNHFLRGIAMKRLSVVCLAALIAGYASQSISQSISESTPLAARGITLVVHGGSGTITRSSITPEIEAQYRASLDRALQAGYAILSKGGTSLDAVVATIKVFEDDPLFNAGKGAVFTNDGRNELDASIMDGKTGLAGAVAGVTTVKNPITAARAVMENTKHVLLVSSGADKFAGLQKLDIVDPSYFYTQHRWDQLQKAKAAAQIQLDHDGKPKNVSATPTNPFEPWMIDYKFGTVGAVALDAHGNLAAGTSTGGLTNKLYGRVGDSPIIGAGTYADNETVAVSGTGTGEFFMRGLVAYDIAARMKYGKTSVSEAVDQTIKSALDDKKGRGGVIALDKNGNVKFGFNTEGMYRGYIKSDGKPVIQVYKD
jgi:beta-aspartyl-peptidase (threonine type)